MWNHHFNFASNWLEKRNRSTVLKNPSTEATIQGFVLVFWFSWKFLQISNNHIFLLNTLKQRFFFANLKTNYITWILLQHLGFSTGNLCYIHKSLRIKHIYEIKKENILLFHVCVGLWKISRQSNLAPMDLRLCTLFALKNLIETAWSVEVRLKWPLNPKNSQHLTSKDQVYFC